MQLEVEISNKTKEKIDEKLFVQSLEKALELSGCNFLKNKNVSVSVAVVDKTEIKKLNRIYRKKNEVTDILSFAEYKNSPEIKRAGDKSIFLGELILCYNDIKEYCKKNNKDARRELAEIVSHGLFHLLGFKHGPKMFKLQNTVAAESIKK